MLFAKGFLFKAPESEGVISISRGAANFAFDSGFCLVCGKVTDQKWHRTGLPGIQAHDCPECGVHHMANFLDDDGDVLDLPSYCSINAFIAFALTKAKECSLIVKIERACPQDSQRDSVLVGLKNRALKIYAIIRTTRRVV